MKPKPNRRNTSAQDSPTPVYRSTEPFSLLEQSVYQALETYSNVHRGSGINSMVSTLLYEEARVIVLEYLGLATRRYRVIFCSPHRADLLKARLKAHSYRCISSADIGLPMGVTAVAVRRDSLPGGIPFQTGGGNARLIAKDWVIWANGPDRYEAGTPAVINVIAFARALRLAGNGTLVFAGEADEQLTATEILYRDEPEGLSGRALLEQLKQTLIGRGKIVPTAEGDRPFINFDNSASTQTFVPVWDAVRRTWQQSVPVQREIIREVKSICAGFLGAPASDYDIVFTSNTTEAVNLAAESVRREPHDGFEPVVLNSLLEHSSNELPWRLNSGAKLIRLPVDPEGFMDLAELDRLLSASNRDALHGNRRIRLVAVSGASNVLGTCNDLVAISRIVHQYGARLLVDAAQLAAHREIRMEEWGIDYLAFSAHKVYAPFGCGVLAVRKGLLTYSDEEVEAINSSGEENAGGIAALGKALLLLQRIGFGVIREEEQALTARALRGMARISGMKVYGIAPDSPAFARKVGVIAFNLNEIIAHTIAKELAVRRGIGIRSGCHCAHLVVKNTLGVSPGLEKFQRIIVTLFPKLSLPGVARVSFGIATTVEEVDTLLRVLENIAAKSPLPKTEVKQKMDGFVREARERVYFQS